MNSDSASDPSPRSARRAATCAAAVAMGLCLVVLVGCTREAPAPIGTTGVPGAVVLTQEPEVVEPPATQQQGQKLHGSFFASTGAFGGGPDFTDADLKRLATELPAGVSKLDLKMTQVTDAGLAALQGAEQITEVYLPPQISDRGLEHLGGMKNLRFVMLEGAQVKGQGLAHLKSLPRLRLLILAESKVTDEGVASVAELSTIEELDLTNARIGDSTLRHFIKLPKLRSLELSGTSVSRKAVAEFQAARPDVTVNGP